MRPRMEPAPRRPVLALASRESARPDDAELVRALRAGEPWAAPAVWNKHAPAVFRVAARVLGSGGDAEDITQEVFVRLFSRVGEIRDPDALGSFVFSIAVRILKWELRRRRVRRIMQLEDPRRLPERAVDAADSEGREALGRLYAILDTLSAEERTAFVLRHMEAMSLSEIAEAMKLSLATVKRRLSLATKRVSALADRDGSLAGYRTRTTEDPRET